MWQEPHIFSDSIGHVNLDAELLAEFARECGAGRLPHLDLAARQFPHARELRRRNPLRQEQAAISDDRARDDLSRRIVHAFIMGYDHYSLGIRTR